MVISPKEGVVPVGGTTELKVSNGVKVFFYEGSYVWNSRWVTLDMTSLDVMSMCDVMWCVMCVSMWCHSTWRSSKLTVRLITYISGVNGRFDVASALSYSLTIYTENPEILVGKWNGTHHSIWSISEIIGYRLNQCIFFSFLFKLTFQLILVHFVNFPFCVWTSCSTEYLHLNFPPGWMV